MSPTLIDAGRIANAVLAAAALLMLLRTVRGWRRRSPGNRFHWSGIALLLVAIGYGSLESTVTQASGGWRIALTTVALGYLLAGLVSKRRGHWTEDAPAAVQKRRVPEEY